MVRSAPQELITAQPSSEAAYSIISDYFPPRKRATAISIYSMGIYIGSGFAFIIGGLVAKFASAQEMWQAPLIGAIHPWQLVFFIVGMPGVLLALLMYTVREPFRRGIRRVVSAEGQSSMPRRISFRRSCSGRASGHSGAASTICRPGPKLSPDP